MRPLFLHAHAAEDLNRLRQRVIAATGGERAELKRTLVRILAVIEQMKAQDHVQDRMLMHDNCDDGIHFEKWASQHRLGRNLWRAKIFSCGGTLGFRIIYAYERTTSINPTARFHILAVVDRDEFDYEHETESEISARIVADYFNL